MESFIDTALNRSKVYKNLSHFYIYIPDQKIMLLDWKPALMILENPIYSNGPILQEIEEGAKILINFSYEKFAQQSLSLLKEWTRFLRGVYIKGPLPPYESVYLTGRLQNKPAQEIYYLFSQMGINIPEEWHQPADYIGVELDFMRLLCEMEMDGWKRENFDSVKETLLIEDSFLISHVGSWVPEFCQIIEDEAHEEYFKGIARLTKGLIEYDKLLIPYIIEKFIH